MNVFGKTGLLIVTVIFLFSCKHIDVFEKSNPIPGQKWKSKFPSKGTFTINDTASYYKIFFVLRHTDAYKYNNIWINIGLQSPGDTMSYQKINCSLGSDANGWYGSGMDDIWEVRKLLTEQPRKFKKSGEYQFAIYQIMRDDPLPAIMSAGIRVEKVASQ